MIFDKLNHLLSPIANAVLAFIAFLQAHQLALALLSGVMLPFIFSAKHGGQEKPTFLQRILILLSMICFVFGSIAPVRRCLPGQWRYCLPSPVLFCTWFYGV